MAASVGAASGSEKNCRYRGSHLLVCNKRDVCRESNFPMLLIASQLLRHFPFGGCRPRICKGRMAAECNKQLLAI